MESVIIKRSLRSVSAAVCVGLALAAAACGSTGRVDSPSPPTTSQGPLLPASPTELPSFDPGKFNALLAQLAAEHMPVVINFWASWCGPCTIEAPQLARVASGLEGKVQFIGVDIQDQLTPARAFIQKYGWPYPSVFDVPGAIRDGFGLVGQPVTLVFDRSGAQAFAWSGAIPADVLTTELNKVLGT
jgi:thiol-disulfide isomerase/thioredoxin